MPLWPLPPGPPPPPLEPPPEGGEAGPGGEVPGTPVPVESSGPVSPFGQGSPLVVLSCFTSYNFIAIWHTGWFND